LAVHGRPSVTTIRSAIVGEIVCRDVVLPDRPSAARASALPHEVRPQRLLCPSPEEVVVGQEHENEAGWRKPNECAHTEAIGRNEAIRYR
jgi:hypothetical protein